MPILLEWMVIDFKLWIGVERSGKRESSKTLKFLISLERLAWFRNLG
jgi:hypothetical protein